MEIALALILSLVLLTVLVFTVMRKMHAKRNNSFLKEFEHYADSVFAAETIKGARRSVAWYRGYPRVTLEFSSNSEQAQAKGSGALHTIADKLSDYIRSSSKYGYNRHTFNAERAIHYSLTKDTVENSKRDRNWWAKDLVGTESVPLGPEIQELVKALFLPNVHDQVNSMVLNNCGANVALPGTTYETVPEIEEAVRLMRFGVLVHSTGSVEKLTEAIGMVSSDFRELPNWDSIAKKYKSWLAERKLD